MGDLKFTSRPIIPTVLGTLAISSALLGTVAWCGYGAFATRGMHLAASYDPAAADRAASNAAYCTITQILLGLLAIVLGAFAIALGGKSNPAGVLARTAIWWGVADLLLFFILI